MSNSSSNSAHILVFPFPAQGHMLPLLDLTHQLALRGLTITILVTPKNLPFLHPLLTKHPSSIQILTLPFPTTTGSSSYSIPSGIENMKDLPSFYFPAMMRAMSELYNPIFHWFESHPKSSSSSSSPAPPVAILSDVFLGWTHHLASQLNIHRIVFIPTCAYTKSLVCYFWRNLPKREDCKNPCYLISAPEIPSSPVFPIYQIFGFYRLYIEKSPIWEFLRENNFANRTSWGIVLNSFTELEQPFLNYLKKDLGNDRVWAVGPLLPMDHEEVKEEPSIIERGGPSSVRVGEVISWLDSCADRSVVYVCFGTQIVLKKRQMEALAMGIEESGANFIWCVKEAASSEVESNSEDAGVIPPGFEERMVERGLVIKGWAPQVAILRHKAVAAYLTHCGWNSVLEGLVAGVLLLLWPMGADHFSNTKLLGDELEVAIKVCEGADTVPNSIELARVLAESVRSGESTQPQMLRATEMRQLALKAVKEGGSSFKSLDDLVENLRELNLIKSNFRYKTNN